MSTPTVPGFLPVLAARIPGPHEQSRILLGSSCRDCDPIPKVPGAGTVDRSGPWPVQLMHNGVRVAADGYCGPWMTQLITALQGHHEPQEEIAFHHLLGALGHASRMIELGSYWSYYSLWFKKHFPEAEIILVEPDPNFLEIGRYNAVLNGVEGEFIPAAVAAAPSAEIPFSCESDGQVRPVRCVSVDSLTAGRGTIDLLLADIQGAELPMLQGMTRLLSEGRLRVLVLSTHGFPISGDYLTHEKCLTWLEEKGARIICEHSVEESYSGDGLIVASFDPEIRLQLDISHCRAREAIGGLLNYEADRLLRQTASAAVPLQDHLRPPGSASGKISPIFISYAQHAEDVLLWRALSGVENGFYIDVGAFHPIEHSVTQAFYERGWHGINIEPVPANAATFPALRPRDLTLMLAVSDESGIKPFYEVSGSGLSTFDSSLLESYRDSGWAITEHQVPVRTLAEICREHAPGDIHFLKVDAEQSERGVFAGADLVNFRPWIILVEAVVPNGIESTHEAWEHLIISAGYEFLFFDGLNRYYASAEKASDLRPHLNRPVNPVDRFKNYELLRLEQKLAAASRDLAVKSASREKKHTPSVGEIAELKVRVKDLQHRLNFHSANPARALKLWWSRLFSGK